MGFCFPCLFSFLSAFFSFNFLLFSFFSINIKSLSAMGWEFSYMLKTWPRVEFSSLSFNVHIFFKINLLILKTKQHRKKDEEARQRHTGNPSTSLPPKWMPTRQGWSQALELHLGLPLWFRGPRAWAIHCFPRQENKSEPAQLGFKRALQ